MTDQTAEASFVAGAKHSHDADPEKWHRAMLRPPRIRSPACEFCGTPWPDDVPAALKRLIPDERIEARLAEILGTPMTRSQLVARLLDHRDNDVRVYVPREGDRGAYVLPVTGVGYLPDDDVIVIGTAALVEEDPDPESPYERGVAEERQRIVDRLKEVGMLTAAGIADGWRPTVCTACLRPYPADAAACPRCGGQVEAAAPVAESVWSGDRG